MFPPHPVQSSSNPYQNVQHSHFYPTYYNSHYVQAYAQQSGPTHFNSRTGQNTPTNYAIQGSSAGREASSNHRLSWYQTGNSRCSHPGCIFTGSSKTVEIHMMDRHLIYPPGWEKRKKNTEWDADPSLKGKPIPIQGTNIILNTPEILGAWIKERKSRFPTGARVADKKRKLEEAIARGQLDVTESRWPNKRRNMGTSIPSRIEQGRRPGYNSNRGRQYGGPRNGVQAVANSNFPQNLQVRESQKAKRNKSPPSISLGSQSDSNDENDEPEAISSKLMPIKHLPPDDGTVPTPKAASADFQVVKKMHSEPRPPPKNLFASRPTLLRNLLLPEIRVTISNLSQAIRFLVDNDFLRDVELKPGQAAETHKIEVLKPERSVQSEKIT